MPNLAPVTLTSTPSAALSEALMFSPTAMKVSTPPGVVRLKAKVPDKLTNPAMSMVRSPRMLNSSPRLPSMSSVWVRPGPVTIVIELLAKSIRRPSVEGRLICTARFSTDRVKSSMPTKPASVTSACNAVHTRSPDCSEKMPRAKSISFMLSPMASSVPPLIPTKTRIPPPPRLSMSVITVSPLSRVTSRCDDSKPRAPLTRKKLKISRVKSPVTRAS